MDLIRDAPTVFQEVTQFWADVAPFATHRRNARGVDWRVEENVDLKFDTIFRSWNDFEGLMSYDWHPADAATWRWLEAQPQGWPTWAAPALEQAEVADDWVETLALGRKRTGKPWKQVASESNLAVSTMYSISSGRRRPNREQVMMITQSLEFDAATRNQLLRALGMSPEPSEYARWLVGLPHRMPWGHSQVPVHPADPQLLLSELGTLRWPCLLLDENCCVAGSNEPIQRALELDGSRLGEAFRQGTHLVDLITHPEVQDRIVNWEEAAVTLLPSSVKPFLNPAISTTDASLFGSAVMNLRRRDPASYDRLVALWDRDPQARLRLRITFPLHWRASDGTQLNFHGLVAGWTALSGYWAIDLHPADSRTFEWLERQS